MERSGFSDRHDYYRRGQPVRRWAAIAAAVIWLAAAVGSSPAAAAPGQEASPVVPTGGRYLEPVFDEVKVTRDVPYRETVDWEGNPQTLRLDIYEPVGDTATKRPVNLIMSGGCFEFIDKELIFGAGEANARMGFVAVSIEYRTRQGLGLCDPLSVDPDIIQEVTLDAYDDAFAAVRWLRDHADEYNIDPQAITPSGGSAGAALAWNLAWLPGSDVRSEESGVPAAVSIAGAPFPSTPDPGDPPVLAVHGTEDTVIPISLAEEPCTEARQIGVRCDFVAYEGAGHPLVDFPHILESPYAENTERRVAEFIAEVVLAPLGYFDDLPPGEPKQPKPPAGGTVEPPKPGEPAPAIPGRPGFTG